MVSKYAKADPRFFHTRERINFMNNRSWKLAIERTIGEITSKMVIDIPKEFCAELERITYAEHTRREDRDWETNGGRLWHT